MLAILENIFYNVCMILICRNCLRIGLGTYDKRLVHYSAPRIVNLIMLLGLSGKQSSVQLMFSMMRLLDYSLDIFIAGISHQDSCHKCMGSRSMVYVYSEEGEQLIINNDIDFPIEDITITVHEPQ